jgi:anti-sigma B factor antagonist
MTTENIQVVASNGSRPGQRILRLLGPLNIQTIFEFQAAVRADESPAVVVDFSGVPYIDSAGLGALVGAFVSAQRAHRRMAFAGMNERVKALLSMTHVNQLVHPFATVEDAEVAIAAPN